MKLRCAVIDDEFLARQYIIEYIHKVPFLELVGDYNSPLKAMEKIRSGQIDLLFLDIQMPDITGIDFLKTIDKQPFVVFTTAYKEFALEGYDLNVSDYLLKPFSFERFLKAVDKVLESAQSHNTKTEPQPNETVLHDKYIIIRANRKHYKINYEDLIYIEGQKAYVSFHTHDRQVTALASLKDLEDNLPQDQFIRIHKSFIVSIKNI